MKKNGVILKAATLAVMVGVIANSAVAATSTRKSTSSKKLSAASAKTQSSTVNSSVSSVSIAQPRLLDNISVMAATSLGGPTVTDPTSLALYSENQIAMGYKLNATTGVGAALNFLAAQKDKGGLMLLNPYIHAKKADLIKRGKFSMAGQARLYPSIMEDSRNKGIVAYTRLMTISNLDLGKSRASVGAVAFAQPYLYNSKRANHANFAKFYLAPNMNYQIRDNIGVNLAFELVGANKHEDGFLNMYETGESCITPSLSWDLNSRVNLNPSLNIPAAAYDLDLKATSVNLAVSMKLL